LSFDCAAAGTDKRLTVKIVSASLRIVAFQLAIENRVHGVCRKAVQSDPERRIV
jgi:hypothetical protein